MDMTQEEIKIYNERSRKEFEMSGMDVSLGIVVPFVLFLGGILTPFFTDDFIVLILSLVPFYVYLFVMYGLGKNIVFRNVIGFLTLMTILGFVLFGVSIIFGSFEGSLGISVGMIEVNSVISIPFILVLYFSLSLENCIPWPYYYFMGHKIEE